MKCFQNCECCKKLYVPPSWEYEDIPKDSYVCTLFLGNSDEVMYLGSKIGEEGSVCEEWREKKS